MDKFVTWRKKKINADFRSLNVQFIVWRILVSFLGVLYVIIVDSLFKNKLISLTLLLVIDILITTVCCTIGALINKSYQQRHKDFLKSKGIYLDVKHGIYF